MATCSQLHDSPANDAISLTSNYWLAVVAALLILGPARTRHAYASFTCRRWSPDQTPNKAGSFDLTVTSQAASELPT